MYTDLSLQERERIAIRVSNRSLLINAVLSLLKFFAGIVAHSGAMVSDAVHSVSDVFSTLIVILGVKISSREADERHQYGHERFESITGIVLSIILALTGLAIGYKGTTNIISGAYRHLPQPGILALVAAIVSIVVKEAMFWYTNIYAKKIKSTALRADAWHHRSDALSSVGSLIGIAGARMGWMVCDSAVSILICVLIMKAAIEIFVDAVKRLTDESLNAEEEEKMKAVILAQEGVLQLDLLQTRKFGARVYVDVEISADGNLKLFESHEIAQKVHDEIEHTFPEVKHCMVHVNPMEICQTQE
ncbi:MAG: cation diffusion facilitator family transporter [Lachnospiraceae bacterium]|nr:cation diffusion facilitator family transporter [Lachnospiraceae bacterium]